MPQVKTGSDDPEETGSAILYYGNDSLLAAPESDSSMEVYGTDGTQDVPRKWEGFGEYKLAYMLRKTGLDYQGNDTVVSIVHCVVPGIPPPAPTMWYRPPVAPTPFKTLKEHPGFRFIA